jgi:Zn-dependent peptidase ImmA (M78 family)/transcriptional regulator with XRE-family HTH domain
MTPEVAQVAQVVDLTSARERAARRRVAGTVSDVDPARLALARRLMGLSRAAVARAVGVTAAAVTQYEKGLTRPTVPVVQGLAELLGVPPEFFRAGHPMRPLASSSAHFRSLRSTTSAEREQALAFAELALALVAAVELRVELPPSALPDLDVAPDLRLANVPAYASRARAALGIDSGPVPHLVRLLEVAGVLVIRFDGPDLERVDAFSHHQGSRPLVVLNPFKNDRARGRFDAAHELGHLLLHHDAEPGSRIVEQQADAFAGEFLAPSSELAGELPSRVDWAGFHAVKRRWGISLKAAVYRARQLRRLSDHSYQVAMRQLAEWGHPEPGDLGPPEVPVLLPRAVELIGGDSAVRDLALGTGLPEAVVRRLLSAGGGPERPVLSLQLP